VVLVFKKRLAMKVYISGEISGLSPPEFKAKFQAAQNLLEGLGFEVVNPIKNGLNIADSWKKHSVRDIELLLDCENILMLDGWQNSVGASIEYDIAVRTGINIMFESKVVYLHKTVLKIKGAIHEATGLQFDEYACKGKKVNKFLARVLFMHHCRKCGITEDEIMKYFNLNYTTIVYSIKKYNTECKYSLAFRKLAQQVDEILNKL
jgi:hypothetical protein